MDTKKIPVTREDDKELLGFIAQGANGWIAQTIFGYPIRWADNEKDATAIVRESGLSFLTGVWQYYDTDDQAWFPGVIKEAYEQQVVVARTTPMGYEDPDDYKLVKIKNPDETNLVKS